MQITNVKLDRYGEMRQVLEVFAGREIWVVSVETDQGITGHGFVTANVSPYGPSGDIARLLVNRNFRNMLVGQDPALTELLWQRMYGAIWRLGRRGLGLQCLGAIDSALWDIKGKAAGVPASRLFGGHRERVKTYANAAHQLPPDKLAEKCLEYVKQGHTAVKIRGSATAVSRSEASERVRLVREAIGPDVRLMVDVNGTWDVDTAVQQLKAWERYDIYWLEEPVHPEDLPGYVAVRRRSGQTLIAGGEQHATMFEFRELLQQGAVDVVQPNVNVTGGITEWLKVHALATSLNVAVSPWDLQHIHIHMAVGLPNVQWIEYFTPDRDELASKLFKGPGLTEVRGSDAVYLEAPTAPGLGIEINGETAEPYLIRE